MTVPSPSSGEDLNAPEETKTLPRVVCTIVLVPLIVLLFPLLFSKNQQPPLSGRYSIGYLLTLVTYFLAIGLTLSAFRASRRHWINATYLIRRFGFLFWFIVWVFLVLAAFRIHALTDDADLENVGYAFLGVGVCAGWIVFYSARHLIRLLTNSALACVVTFGTLFVVEVMLAFLPIVSSGVETLRDQKIKLIRYELALRSGRKEYESALMTDPELGYKHRPNFVLKVKGLTDSTAKELRTDAWGFFNHDYDSSRPCDVAVVGDSFAAQTWCLNLAEKTGLRVACLGMPGYGPPQYTVVTKRYAVKLKPKVLFYCIYVNDAVDASHYEAWKNSGVDWFTFQGSSWFGFPNAHSARLLVEKYLLSVSRVFTLLDLSGLQNKDKDILVTAHPIPYKTDQFDLVFDRVSFVALSNVGDLTVKRGLDVTRGCLEQAAMVCRENNVKIIVLLFPPKELVHYEALKKRTKPEDHVEHLPEFYQTLGKLCEDLHLNYYDLTERFRQAVAKTGKAYYGQVDCHWDKDGMDLMVEIAADILAQSGEFKGRMK